MMQCMRLKKALGVEQCQMDYIEGKRPFKKENVDPRLVQVFGDGPYWGWYGVESDGDSSVDFKTKIADPSVTFTYVDVDLALDRVEAHISAHGPYDVLLGFSQGGIVVTMLTARRLERAARGEAPPPSWRCNVLLSSMPPRAGPYHRPPDTSGPPPVAGFPVISVMGRRDDFYEYAKGLRQVHDTIEWLEHGGGHEAPASPEANAEVAAAIWSVVGGSPSYPPPPPINRCGPPL